jgi:hypothetical protein
MEAILEVCGNYEIDMNRIYVAGCSMGGYGTNSIIAAYPDFFAAAMPNCPASVITPEEAEALVDLPIIYIHSLNDTTVTPANSITSYNNIKAAGSDKIWCNFFTHNPPNPVTGADYMGHWSWTWIHNNYTSTEEEFISGEGVFVRNDTEYPYVSTPLSEIGDGYATIAHWLADQKKEVAFDGEFNFYSTCYGYGEEVHTVALETEVELDPATVSPDDFEVYFNAITCGSMRRTDRVVESVEVDGKYVVLNLVMRGSGTNAAIDPENFHVGIVGEVADVEGNIYNAGHFTAVAQINRSLTEWYRAGWQTSSTGSMSPRTMRALRQRTLPCTYGSTAAASSAPTTVYRCPAPTSLTGQRTTYRISSAAASTCWRSRHRDRPTTTHT